MVLRFVRMLPVTEVWRRATFSRVGSGASERRARVEAIASRSRIKEAQRFAAKLVRELSVRV